MNINLSFYDNLDNLTAILNALQGHDMTCPHDGFLRLESGLLVSVEPPVFSGAVSEFYCKSKFVGSVSYPLYLVKSKIDGISEIHCCFSGVFRNIFKSYVGNNTSAGSVCQACPQALIINIC